MPEPGAVATGSSNNKLICNDHGPGRFDVERLFDRRRFRFFGLGLD